jgi:parallel beta-helix repeat protein
MLRSRRPAPVRKWLSLTAACCLIVAVPWVSTAGQRDATPPSLRFTAPGSGDILDGMARVAGRARDRSGITVVNVRVDQGAIEVATGTTSWALVLDTNALEEGNHTISAQAADGYGNIASVSIDVTIANAPPPDVVTPTITIGTPGGGDALSGVVTFSGTASDDRAIATIELQVDQTTAVSVPPSAQWSATIDTSGFENGEHALTVRAVDEAGNVGSSTRSYLFENTGGPDEDPAPEPPSDGSTGPPPPPSPEPSPFTCSGVEVGPGDDLQARIGSHPQGTTFCVREGVYAIASGVLVKSDDRIIGEPGAVLDGLGVASRGVYGFGTQTGQRDVVIRGLVIRGVAGTGIKAGWGWTIVNNTVHGSTIGVAVNKGTILRSNHIHHNSMYGIVGGPATNILIESNELAFNGGIRDAGGSTGGSKIVGSTPGTYGVVWRDNWVHHNTGPGIWSDGNVHDVLYEGNLVEGNSGPGIFHEISWDATISNNVVRGNATDAIGRSCWWGSQIHVNNSQNVRIFGNRVRSTAGANGICLVDAIRSQTSPFPTQLANIEVRDNTIILSGSAMTGLVGQAARSLTFDRNSYLVPDLTGKFWAWHDRFPLTWSEFRMRAGETTGIRQLDV